MRPGSLVELVDDSNMVNPNGEILPVKKKIYEIREIVHRPAGVGLLLVEIINKEYWYYPGFYEAAFNIKRFAELACPVSISIDEPQCELY